MQDIQPYHGNAVPPMLARAIAKIAPGDGYEGTGLGVYPWYDKPHPKCPLKNKKVG